MKTNFKIGKVEAICAVCIIMVNRIILNLPYAIIQNTGVGSPLNLIYIGILGLLFILLLNKLFDKFPNSDIIDISEYLGGKFLKIIVSVIFICFFFITLFMTLADFTNLLQIIYFNNSPAIFILLFFIIAMLVSNLIGFRSIIKTICLIVPFTIFSILLSFVAVYDDFSISKLTPILGDGTYSIFVDGLSNFFAFSIINFFFFFKPLLKNSYDFSKVTIYSFLISWGLLFLTIISLLFVLPITNDGSNINFLYLLSRKISLGDFLQKIDALFILLWILSIFSYLSIISFIMNSIFKKITHASDGNMFIYLISSALLGICLYPFNISEIKFIQTTVYKYFVLILMFGVSFSILLLANWKFKRKKILRRQKMKRKISISIILILVLITLTGCYDASSIEDSYYIVALGIDLSENNLYDISIQIAKNKSSSSSSSDSSQSSSYTIYTVEAETVESGLTILNNYLNKKLNLSHCSAIVFSEDLARKRYW